MRRLLVLVSIVAMVAAAAVVVRDDGGAERTGSVTLVGDSLNVGIEPYLADVLPGWTIQKDDEVGRGTPAGLEALRGFGSRLSPTVVVSLGTNDPVGSGDAFRDSVAEALEVAGPRRCVVWVTIADGVPRVELNQVLREAAGANRTLRLVEWATMVEEEPELLTGDGVHGTAEGYRRRAEAVADAVRGCAPDAR